MADVFSESSSVSWLGRLGESFKNVLFGLLLFFGSFVLLFWNEGRAVETARSLTEGSHAVMDVEAGQVDGANEGKLVHVTGRAESGQVLKDGLFPVSANALKLQRMVEMYQWKESEHSETHKTLTGGKETTTTYTYERGWSERWNDSNRFKHPENHVNPPQDVASNELVAQQITIGAFQLSKGLVDQIKEAEAVMPGGVEGRVAGNAGGAEDVGNGFRLMGPYIYRGEAMERPAVGDLRVTFKAVMPQVVSVVAQQAGYGLRGYQTHAGLVLEMLTAGDHGAGEMFKTAEVENEHRTWLLRLVGFVAMWFGLMLVVQPLQIAADLLPFMGNFVGAGLGLLTVLVALPLSLVTIGVAWVVFRPLLGMGLLAGAGVVVWGLCVLVGRGKREGRVEVEAG